MQWRDVGRTYQVRGMFIPADVQGVAYRHTTRRLDCQRLLWIWNTRQTTAFGTEYRKFFENLRRGQLALRSVYRSVGQNHAHETAERLCRKTSTTSIPTSPVAILTWSYCLGSREIEYRNAGQTLLSQGCSLSLTAATMRPFCTASTKLRVLQILPYTVSHWNSAQDSWTSTSKSVEE